MASQLLPIRNLGTAAIFRASHSSSFSRFLAQLKLKNFPFSSRPCRLVHRREYTGGQTFSPRSARSGDNRSGKLRMGSVSGSKSLIEDEAELSDWVSDIRKDAFHRKLSSEDESSARDRGTGSKVRDRDLLKSKGGERNFRPAVHGGPSSRRIRDGGRRIDSDDSGDDFPRRMSSGRGNWPGDSYDSRRGPGANGRGTSAFSKRDGGGYGIGGGLDRGKRESGDYAKGARFGESRRDGGDYGIGGRLGQSKRGRGDYQFGDRLGQRKMAAPVVSKNDDDDDDDDFLSDEDNGRGNRPGSTSDSRKRPVGAGRGTSIFSKRGERDYGIGERMGQDRRSGGDSNIGVRLGQSRRGGEIMKLVVDWGKAIDAGEVLSLVRDQVKARGQLLLHQIRMMSTTIILMMIMIIMMSMTMMMMKKIVMVNLILALIFLVTRKL
ncbi:DEAD-box ATP-dependent RNA helicase 26 [Platanthera guangdongensis]|uniref:DEAD-box ATP-dependent RNA helicase 26 n=1 Tax=Platanthera guangdongensis TaxID=2320717 RepID=A0ABR2LYC3_9ASPA